jgi:hypothetical protein
MATYEITEYFHEEGKHDVLQQGDCFEWDGGKLTAMLIRRVDGNAQAILLLQPTATGTWTGTYREKEQADEVRVELSFNGAGGDVSRIYEIGIVENDTGSFTATQQM